jgi:hypothetical protein
LDFCQEQPAAQFQPCIAKLGYVTDGGILRGTMGAALRLTGMVTTITVQEAAAAILEQVVSEKGIEKESVLNEDLVKIGREVLARNDTTA